MCNCTPLIIDPAEKRGWSSGAEELTCEMCVQQDKANTILCEDCLRTGDLISAEQVCDIAHLELEEVYQMARSGEIPGAVWDETLHFKREEFDRWFLSLIESELRELEEDGLLGSYVDSDGRRIYYSKESLH
jgi:hypothetical protein